MGILLGYSPYLLPWDTVEYSIYPKDWTDSPELTVEIDQTPPYIKTIDMVQYRIYPKYM